MNQYTVAADSATKITITISRRQLWNNYVEKWRDIAWDGAGAAAVDRLAEVSNVLTTKGPLDYLKLRKLFRDGQTVLMLGDAMSRFQVPNTMNLLREVFVVDEENKKSIVIRHEDICF